MALVGVVAHGWHDALLSFNPGAIHRLVLAGLSFGVLLGDVQNMHRGIRRVPHPYIDPYRHDVPDEPWYPDCHRTHRPGAGDDSRDG